MGINAYTIRSNESVWGKDVHEFRPERWLVSKTELAMLDQHFLAASAFFSAQSETHVNKNSPGMANTIIQFGAGARTCLGKNISMLEMSKLLPQIVRRFDFVAEGNTEWQTSSGWFVKQKIQVKVIDREGQWNWAEGCTWKWPYLLVARRAFKECQRLRADMEMFKMSHCLDCSQDYTETYPRQACNSSRATGARIPL